MLTGKLAWIAAGSILLALAAWAHLPMAGAPQEPSRSTIEPLPPLTLDAGMTDVQKHVRGGMASLTLRVGTSVDLDDIVVKVQLPRDVTFKDGSQARGWSLGLRAGQRLEIPADLLARHDGPFVVPIEATARFRGRTIRRGIAYDLTLGAQRELPRRRNGAIEYRALPGEGGR
jgi:hypothetical protein